MSTPLLTTKLYRPPVRPERVPRPRLVERLNGGLQRKLTLICAPAGFGKTTLLSEWVTDSGRPVAWLSLDDQDNDTTRFWTYLIAALQTVHTTPSEQALGQDSLKLLQAPQPPATQVVLTPLLNEVAALAQANIALVLDDYHLITNQAIHEGLAFLLDHQPANLHLVISTRADPPLPVFRLRARGQLTELRSDDLRFTSGEAATFLNSQMGLDLGPGDVTALESRTEGWIVGLQLAALALQGMRARQGRAGARRFIAAFSGSHHYVLEYLTEEVVRRQTEAVRRFLMLTSVLDRLCGPLCDALTGERDGEAMLADLQRRNLFIVPLDAERRWYRYHHLFADLLANLLRKERPPARIRELHLRASEWHEQNGDLEEAIQQALQAEAFERAADLIEGAAQTLIAQGRLTGLLRWLEALPAATLRARPRLCLYQGWALNLSGQIDRAGQILQETKVALESRPPSPRQRGPARPTGGPADRHRHPARRTGYRHPGSPGGPGLLARGGPDFAGPGLHGPGHRPGLRGQAGIGGPDLATGPGPGARGWQPVSGHRGHRNAGRHADLSPGTAARRGPGFAAGAGPGDRPGRQAVALYRHGPCPAGRGLPGTE